MNSGYVIFDDLHFQSRRRFQSFEDKKFVEISKLLRKISIKRTQKTVCLSVIWCIIIDCHRQYLTDILLLYCILL